MDGQTDSFIVTKLCDMQCMQRGNNYTFLHFKGNNGHRLYSTQSSSLACLRNYSQSKHAVNVDTHLAQPRAELKP